LRPEVGRGVAQPCRNQRRSTAENLNSGERFPSDGGGSGSESKGRWERRLWP
jgi:hypothetical protein